MNKIFGITGGIGSGKTTASKFFEELGIKVIDSDKIGKKIISERKDVLEKIIKHFGVQVLSQNNNRNNNNLEKNSLNINIQNENIDLNIKNKNSLNKKNQNKIESYKNNKILDRNKLRKIIFENDLERKWLENLLHPLIKDEVIKILKDNLKPYCLVEAPILIESNFKSLVNKIIVIDCDYDKQISRTMKKNNFTKDEIKKIMNAQLNRNDRLKYADYIIENNTSKNDLQKKVLSLHKQIIKNL